MEDEEKDDVRVEEDGRNERSDGRARMKHARKTVWRSETVNRKKEGIKKRIVKEDDVDGRKEG